jgi:ABC-type uncharacterized transport system substrate-binding protein
MALRDGSRSNSTPMLLTPRAVRGRGRLLFAAGVMLLPAAQAAAHPHVWINATVAPVFDETNRLVAVREKWMLDVEFTEGVGPDLDVNKDGILEAPEIQNAAANGTLWFVPYGYFTRVTLAGRQVATAEVRDFRVTIPGAHMVVEFTLPLAEPAAVTSAGIDVYDAEFYVDVQFADPGIDTTLVPAQCLATRREQANLDPVAVMLIRRLGLAADPAVINDPAAGFAVRVAIACR